MDPRVKPAGLRASNAAFEPVSPRDEDAVAVICGLLAADEWKSGISITRYARLWGLPVTKVRELVRAARVVLRIEGRPETLGLIAEMRTHACRKVYELDDEMNDDRDPFKSAMLALKVCDVQFKLLQTQRDSSEQDSYARLAEMSDEELRAEVDTVEEKEIEQ
jgi:hypothetical protein